MYLVIHKVVKLQKVHVSDGHLVVERLSRPPVVKRDLPRVGQARHLEGLADLRLLCAVEHGNRYVHAILDLVRELDQLVLGQLLQESLHLPVPEDLLHPAPDQGRVIRLDELADGLAELFGRPAKMRFQYLARVHTRRHAQGVQDHVDRRPVLGKRHILFRQDHGDDPLVSVSSRNLVAHRDLPLHGHVDLDRLRDARRQLVALLDLVYLVFVVELYQLDLVFLAVDDLGDPRLQVLVLKIYLLQPVQVDAVDLLFREGFAFLGDRRCPSRPLSPWARLYRRADPVPFPASNRG